MFKLVLISTLIVAACCMPAEKYKSHENLEQSETQWNSAWANPAANPNAAWGGNSWNRWNNPAAATAADPRLNRWGAEPWNRQYGANAGWNQWNRAGAGVGAGAWPAAGAPAAAAVNRGWNTW
ncbi:bifunctional endo-1,4-beta-xylanase XylA-like isoform X2 [Ochlerotatus camptorhynchus]|uniref:bifunctional endo-1,4-beta-xylanase XylA-like isoform X1 n=1 Tax=Ochlerotatus camptorhynchus TaxID=644619 RepID=UPI0031CF2C21